MVACDWRPTLVRFRYDRNCVRVQPIHSAILSHARSSVRARVGRLRSTLQSATEIVQRGLIPAPHGSIIHVRCLKSSNPKSYQEVQSEREATTCCARRSVRAQRLADCGLCAGSSHYSHHAHDSHHTHYTYYSHDTHTAKYRKVHLAHADAIPCLIPHVRRRHHARRDA